jgi:hypothetical protein
VTKFNSTQAIYARRCSFRRTSPRTIPHSAWTDAISGCGEAVDLIAANSQELYLEDSANTEGAGATTHQRALDAPDLADYYEHMAIWTRAPGVAATGFDPWREQAIAG